MVDEVGDGRRGGVKHFLKPFTVQCNGGGGGSTSSLKIEADGGGGHRLEVKVVSQPTNARTEKVPVKRRGKCRRALGVVCWFNDDQGMA